MAGGEGIIADIEEEEAVKKALILRGDRALAREGLHAGARVTTERQRSAGVSGEKILCS